MPDVDTRGSATKRHQLRAVGRALAKLVVTLAALSVVTFAATSVIPGDPARSALGRFVSNDQLETFREQQGLNRPIPDRYAQWLGGFVTGEWGQSLLSKQPVVEDAIPRFGRTVILAFAGFLLMLPLSILVGIWTGRRPRSAADRFATLATLLVSSLPEFVVGMVLLVVLAAGLGLFPIQSGSLAFQGASVGATVGAYALPAIALALIASPYVIRMLRSTTHDVSSTPYIGAAVLRGVHGVRLTYGHILPNAVLPLIGIFALTLAQLVGGVVVIEALFGFPGAGQLLVKSVQAHDIPTVQALVMLIGGFFVSLNILADLAMRLLDARIQS